MGVGVVLMEEIVIDMDKGFFFNYDLVSYEVLVYLDILEQQVIFLDMVDLVFMFLKVKGVGEFGFCGVVVVIVNVVYNVLGVWIWDFLVIVDKLLVGLGQVLSCWWLCFWWCGYIVFFCYEFLLCCVIVC